MKTFRYSFIVSSLFAVILLFSFVNSAKAVGERVASFPIDSQCTTTFRIKEDFNGPTPENNQQFLLLNSFAREFVNDQDYSLRPFYNLTLVADYNRLINSNAAGRSAAERTFNTDSEKFAQKLDITTRVLGNLKKAIVASTDPTGSCLSDIATLQQRITTVAAKADELKITQFGLFEQDLSIFGFPSTIDAFVRQDNPLVRYIIFIVNIATAVIVVIALMLTVLGGYRYMTAGGDGKNVEEAKKYIKAAILGIVLALLAFLLLSQISTQFTQNLQEPGANGANGNVQVGGAGANNGNGFQGGGGDVGGGDPAGGGGDVDFGGLK